MNSVNSLLKMTGNVASCQIINLYHNNRFVTVINEYQRYWNMQNYKEHIWKTCTAS